MNSDKFPAFVIGMLVGGVFALMGMLSYRLLGPDPFREVVLDLERCVSALGEANESLDMCTGSLNAGTDTVNMLLGVVDDRDAIINQCIETADILVEGLDDRDDELRFCWTQTVTLGACYQNPVFCPWYKEE